MNNSKYVLIYTGDIDLEIQLFDSETKLLEFIQKNRITNVNSKILHINGTFKELEIRETIKLILKEVENDN